MTNLPSVCVCVFLQQAGNGKSSPQTLKGLHDVRTIHPLDDGWRTAPWSTSADQWHAVNSPTSVPPSLEEQGDARMRHCHIRVFTASTPATGASLASWQWQKVLPGPYKASMMYAPSTIHPPDGGELLHEPVLTSF
ncbi:hypothetical protein Taro_039259 [Colocasia esculenta]|uniref:Uncharacterized protein n=1 Tax=Colocasia esculenta TaxID=4460 RepID=A0A843WA84_COLES|nr:hypothetical protein [Colocasia esculenta]